jgi:hypothetical protein
VQASCPVEPAWALLSCCSIWSAEHDVVVLSSSDTEEVLELLFQNPNRDPISRVSEVSSSSDSDQFEDWPEAYDTAVSIYVVPTMDVSSSRTSAANAPRGK